MNLNRRICPGCGAENPKSQDIEFFSCLECGWEIDHELPTIGRIAELYDSLTDCRNVNLPAFLRTLLKEETK